MVKKTTIFSGRNLERNFQFFYNNFVRSTTHSIRFTIQVIFILVSAFILFLISEGNLTTLFEYNYNYNNKIIILYYM